MRKAYGHTAKECRSSIQGGTEKHQCAQCGKRHHGQCWTRSYTSTNRELPKRGWKVAEKGDGKGTQKCGKPKAEKVEPKGKVKEKRKKGQRLNELREPPEEQWASGSWEQWSEQSWQTEADGASWRETDDWSAYTAESGSQASAAEEFQHASFGELRLSNFGAASRIEAFQLDRLDLLTEPSHLALTLHAKLLLLPISLRRAGT